MARINSLVITEYTSGQEIQLIQCFAPLSLACEQQTHFRTSLLSLRKIGREAMTGNASAVRRLPSPIGARVPSVLPRFHVSNLASFA